MTEQTIRESEMLSVSMNDEEVTNSPTSTSTTDLCGGRSDTFSGYTVVQAIEKLGFGPFQLVTFLICSLTWFATVAEQMILTVLSPAVKCQWSLSNNEEAMITALTFVGYSLGSIFWGIMADKFGRKKPIFGTILVTLIFGVLSALKLTSNDARLPGYPWMLLCRFGVGFGISGAAVASTYYIEFLPLKKRAICTVFVLIGLNFGTIFVAALAIGVLGPNKLGWHWYLGLIAIPLLILLFFIPFVPESARFQVSKGKMKEATQVLSWVAWINFTYLPPGELLISPKSEDDGIGKKNEHVKMKESDRNSCGENFLSSAFRKSLPADRISNIKSSSERKPLISQRKTQIRQKQCSLTHYVLSNVARLLLLFSNGMWKITIPLCCLWFGANWIYYGGILLTTTMLLGNPGNESEISISNLSYIYSSESIYDGNQSNATSCKDSELDTDDYYIIMYAAAATVPCILLTIVIIEIIGRKLTMIVNHVITTLGFCLLFIATSKTLLTFFFFIIQEFSLAVFETLYVYTLEIYPTNIRRIGIGLVSALSRLGAITTPYVAQVLFQASEYAAIGLYAGSCLVLVLVSLLLSIETRGRSLE